MRYGTMASTLSRANVLSCLYLEQKCTLQSRIETALRFSFLQKPFVSLMAKKPKKSPLVDRCIFWDASRSHTPLDYEHIWGKWLRQYVRSDANKHRMLAETIGEPGTPNRTQIKLRAGDPLQSNLKIVCKQCNSTWMSALQNDAKKILIPLIQGRKTTLGASAQNTLAAWCTMATMTGEYLTQDAAAISISQSERDWLRDHRSPPNNWRIWIGYYPAKKGMWHHFVVPILGGRDVANAADNRLAPPNTQSTTFIVGNLCVSVLSSTGDPDIVSRWNWPMGSRLAIHLPQIFPPKESFIVWPPQSLMQAEIDLVTAAFESVIDAASRSSFLNRRMF